MPSRNQREKTSATKMIWVIDADTQLADEIQLHDPGLQVIGVSSLSKLTALLADAEQGLPEAVVFDHALTDEEGRVSAKAARTALGLLAERGFDGPSIAYVSSTTAWPAVRRDGSTKVFRKVDRSPREVIQWLRDALRVRQRPGGGLR